MKFLVVVVVVGAREGTVNPARIPSAFGDYTKGESIKLYLLAAAVEWKGIYIVYEDADKVEL